MVKVGDKVKAGEQIAKVGASGPATGPHLHLEIWKDRFYSSDANVVDPVAFLKKRGVDLKANASGELRRVRQELHLLRAGQDRSVCLRLRLLEGLGSSGTKHRGHQQARCDQRVAQWRLRQGPVRLAFRVDGPLCRLSRKACGSPRRIADNRRDSDQRRKNPVCDLQEPRRAEHAFGRGQLVLEDYDPARRFNPQGVRKRQWLDACETREQRRMGFVRAHQQDRKH